MSRSFASHARDLLKVCGPRGATTALWARAQGRAIGFDAEVDTVVSGSRLLEIGGPSAIFQSGSLVDVYGRAGAIDNVNYAGATLWEADLKDGGAYCPEGRRMGTQWLREATDLGEIDPYDGVISSHTIEHTANPLQALEEWRRATVPGGFLVLVVPHADGTFDHRRQVTSLDHLRQDQADQVGEDDRTHVGEILDRHDVGRDRDLASHGQLRDRIERNIDTRAMHHHVFDTRSVWDMVAASGWTPELVEARWPHDIVLLARVGSPPVPLGRFRSPFPMDRKR